MLADISTDYYTRLEQGRERHPSRAVAEGLSLALLLDEPAARYLTGLAIAEPKAAAGLTTERLDAVCSMLDGWDATPAILVNRWLDVVAANALGGLLYAGLDHRENYARMVFLSANAPNFFLDWTEFANCTVSALRGGAGFETSAAPLVGLVGELSLRSTAFSESWARHDLYEKTIDRKRFQHPLVGRLELDQHVLELPGAGGHHIWAYHSTDTETRGRLTELAGLATSTSRKAVQDDRT